MGLLESVRAAPIPGSQVDSVIVEGVQRNLDDRCLPIVTDVSVQRSMETEEQWSIQNTIQTTTAIEAGIGVGLEFSGTNIGAGLSSRSSWTNGTAYSNTVALQYGDGLTFSQSDVVIDPCYQYVVRMVSERTKYHVTINSYDHVYSINAYCDGNGNGQWDPQVDQRCEWKISCGGPNADGRPRTTTGNAILVDQSQVIVEWLGQEPVPSYVSCPC